MGPSPIVRIRRLRWLPRAALALFVVAMMQTTLLPCAMAASSPMPEHCLYCPPIHDMDRGPSDCAFLHANDAYAGAHEALPIDNLPPLIFATHAVNDDWRIPKRLAISTIPLAPFHRPLHLTHCVQLK